MMAACMALQAFAIDGMLPALADIGRDFAVDDANGLQWVITSFLIGNGLGQLLFGPLADRYGRRPVVLGSVTLFGALSLAATAATSLPMLLGTRVVQGFIAAGCGIVPRSIVRDRFSGSTMARVMSSIFIIFLLVPMVAPAVGQALLLVVNWRGIFAFLALCSLGVMAWMLLRLPETLPPERRRPLNSAHLFNAARFVLTEPSSILYTLAVTAMFGSIIAFVSTVPQIFTESFHRPDLMSLVFALCAGGMGVASFCNTRIVERVGMHRVSHLALVGFVSVTALHALLASFTHEGLATFAVLQSLTMFGCGLSVSNFGTIAMQPMGAIAGSAASVQGVISTVGAALIAALIGQQWSGSVAFLPLGALGCGLFAFACVLLAERSRMFRARSTH